MKKERCLPKVFICAIIFLLCSLSVIEVSTCSWVGKNLPQTTEPLAGQILFSPMVSSFTYLIDRDGTISHTWPSYFFPGEAVYWLGDGTILRAIKVGLSPGSGGAGGGIQKVKADGTIVWDFRYNTDGLLSHHDIEPLPNGNVLMIACETKTYQEAVAAGRNPNTLLSFDLMPDHIIEVRPTGPTSGEIVWEWHAWDHLIQDVDPTKANYGVVADHPELVDINYVTASLGPVSDWLHTNSIDYHEKFDQILLSVRNFNEIWVIDHSTTPFEAAGHSGGACGKGGDLLYRWGNPAAYRRGTVSDQLLFNQHDASWIQKGCPGEGNILIFNNGANRPGGSYSSVDEIVPPVNATGQYALVLGSAYGPVHPVWSYSADPLTSFYSSYISGAQRLPDGNTLICDGDAGRFFEVTSEKVTVWEYINTYPMMSLNNVFKICFIPACSHPSANVECTGSLSWTRVRPGETVTGSFTVQNSGAAGSLLNWTVNGSSLDWGAWSFSPSSGDGLAPEDGPIAVEVSMVAPAQASTKFEGYIRVENKEDPTDFDVIPVMVRTQFFFRQQTPFITLFQYLRSLFPFFSFFEFLRQYVFFHRGGFF